ncbi:hypothetical protein RIVM261_054470 [Rivularia sp. IAM M-261]|nr:hypothetical protein RIVM261_054470 [Rivularia sp. IAM M-261]
MHEKTNQPFKYTCADILQCLDYQNIDGGFPAFSNLNIDMLTARLRGFRNQSSWVIIFEHLVNWYAAEGIQPILIIDAVANCFPNKQDWLQESFYPVEIKNETELEHSRYATHTTDKPPVAS